MPVPGSSQSVDLDATIRDLAPRLLRYGLARTGDPDLAEEIAQESLAALVRRWRGSGPPESVEAFTFAIARRRAGRLLWRRRFVVPLEALAAARDRAPDAEARAAARAEQARVRKALARIGRRDREVLLMVAVGEMPQAEAAAALGLTVSAVKMRLHRARLRLVALLDEGRTG
jgi:RNA polymerase sigma-70 factor (ECF subfamily)